MFSIPTETKCSSFARTEMENQKDPVSNGTMNARPEVGNQQGPYSNGVAKHVIPPTSKTSQTVTSAAATPSNDLPNILPLPQNGENKPKT